MKIKGFDENLKCGGFQYEIGKTYDTGAKKLELCTNTVFHYCDSLSKVHQYFEVNETNRFCEIEVLGEEITDDEKCGTNRIKVLREIVGEELGTLAGKINGNTGLFNTGYWNTGYWNTGNRNTGDWNTGYWNTGYWNTGYWNTGDRNTGNWNTGNWNTGYWNACNRSNGAFCTLEPKINIFNMPSNMTLTEFRNSEYAYALNSAPFNLTEWVNGKTIKYTYEEACATWWGKLSNNNKKIIKSMPNFDAEIFREITGIEV